MTDDMNIIEQAEADARAMRDEIERLCKCNNDLQARIDWLITTYSSYGEDGIFVFPDGEYWEARRG